MSRGRHLSLEEARKAEKLERFAKEHPSKGSWERFDKGLAAMTDSDPNRGAKIRRARHRTSMKDASAD